MAGKKITRAVSKTGKKITRREVIKKAAYVTPIILTLAAKPSFARTGSPIQRVSKAGKSIKGKYSKGKYASSKYSSGKSSKGEYASSKYSSGKGSSSKGRRVRVSYGQHSWGKSK